MPRSCEISQSHHTLGRTHFAAHSPELLAHTFCRIQPNAAVSPLATTASESNLLAAKFEFVMTFCMTSISTLNKHKAACNAHLGRMRSHRRVSTPCMAVKKKIWQIACIAYIHTETLRQTAHWREKQYQCKSNGATKLSPTARCWPIKKASERGDGTASNHAVPYRNKSNRYTAIHHQLLSSEPTLKLYDAQIVSPFVSDPTTLAPSAKERN